MTHRILLASIALLLAPAAGAQPQPSGQGAPRMAPAEPTPDPSMPAGTVSVRVVDGSMSKAMTGVEVSLVDSKGKARVARTGSDGRATFGGLSVGTRFVAFAKLAPAGGQGGAEAAPVEFGSNQFGIPAKGGVRILLSPRPITADSGGAEAAPKAAPASPHGAGGPAAAGPDPRRMSGVPRGEQKLPAGSLTVRAIAGPFFIDPVTQQRLSDFPKDQKIHIVSYAPNAQISMQTLTVDDEGRVRLDKQATDNSRSLHALALFSRPEGYDRLQSAPMSLPPQVGMALALAGHKPGSGKPPVDDHIKMMNRKTAPPAGVVEIELSGQAQPGPVELVDVATGSVVATVNAGMDSSVEVRGRATKPVPDAALKAGVAQVLVSRQNQPVPGVTVRFGEGDTAKTAVTDDRGIATATEIPTGQALLTTAIVQGQPVQIGAVTLPAETGVRIGLRVDWRNNSRRIMATFRGVIGGPDKVFVARVDQLGQKHLSPPFQLTDTAGAGTSIIVYNNLVVNFHGGTEVDNKRLRFQLEMQLTNVSNNPMVGPKNGIPIPLPNGFVESGVAEEMQSRVIIEPGEGLVWRGAFPPGRRSVRLGFALPVDITGSADFSMDMPYGLFDSQIVFTKFDGLELVTPESANKQVRQGRNGREFVLLSGIRIPAGKSLAFSIRGLPQPAKWKSWAPNIVGAVILMVLLAALYMVFARSGEGIRDEAAAEQRDLHTRRERLLDDVAALDADHDAGKVKKSRYDKRRAQLVRQLESIYTQLGDSPR